MNRARAFGRVLLAAALPAVTASLAAAEAPARVVRLAERSERVSAAGPDGLGVEIDVGPLGAARRIELELPGGRVASARRSELEPRLNGDLLWSGTTARGEAVILTVAGGRLAGTIFGRERGYRIFPHGSGEHRLHESDTQVAPECGGAPVWAPGDAAVEPRAGSRPSVRSVSRTPRIDLLVVYASESTAVVGSKRNMRAIIQHYVDLTNVAFHNSEVAARVRLAHLAEVTLPGEVVGDHGRILDWLSSSAAIADLRSAHGADLTGIVYERGSGVCGSAGMIYRPGGPTSRRAFFVSRRLCGADTFAHEVGHLMGADHNPQDATVASGQYIYGRAHYHSGRYRTVMSYPTECDEYCPSQPFFSNPGVRHDGRATGIRQERHNARILDEFAADIEGFSAAVDDPGCALDPGDPDYCLECGPCLAGEGNCEADSECAAGLRCAAGSGADFGFASSVNVCRRGGGCALDPGDPDYCRRCGPCGFGDGDCDSDRECQPGLICLDDVGATFGLPAATDVCAFRERGFCPLAPGHPDYCAVCGPCQAGEGNCRSNAECGGLFLTCFANVGGQLGFKESTDICLPAAPADCPFAPGTQDYCKLCGVCDVGEGDCDTDRECRSGLSCVDGAGVDFGFGDTIDVCLESAVGGALAAPKRLRAKALPPSRVRLRWKDKSTDEDGFHVEMSVDGGPFSRLETVAANRRRMVVGGLAGGTRYSFRVQAFNAAGTSAYSNEKSVTLP